jgi:Uma2 family endonuclease
MPGVKKAELIEGVVYMPSPVRFQQHGQPHSHLIGWLFAYEAQTPGVAGGDNTTLRLDQKNEPQPDAVLMIESASGGQSRVDRDGYIEGAPELVAEIASSSVSIDLHDKLEVYRRNGVREYLAWRVLDRAVDWFSLRDGQYQTLAPDNEGILRSEVFPGLWLHFPAMLDGKLDVVLATLERGIATSEHREFAAKLKPTQP